MGIHEIRVYAVPLPAVVMYNMSTTRVVTPASTVVAVEDTDGTVGFGEVCVASPHAQPANNEGIRMALSVLAPAVLGLDPLRTAVINAAMDSAMDGNSEAKAALDVACWDLAG